MDCQHWTTCAWASPHLLSLSVRKYNLFVWTSCPTFFKDHVLRAMYSRCSAKCEFRSAAVNYILNVLKQNSLKQWCARWWARREGRDIKSVITMISSLCSTWYLFPIVVFTGPQWYVIYLSVKTWGKINNYYIGLLSWLSNYLTSHISEELQWDHFWQEMIVFPVYHALFQNASPSFRQLL